VGTDTAPPCAALQLLPDWTPSSVDARLASFDALLKIPQGCGLEPGAIRTLLLNEQGSVLATDGGGLRLDAPAPLAGPIWKLVRGRLVRLPDKVDAACAVIHELRSPPVARRDATRPVVLQPIASQVGLAGEPHLWWRFYNNTPDPIDVYRIFRTTTLRLDERRLPPPAEAYNGPAHLPPGRGISGLWSLDDFDQDARRGPHRFQLGVLDERSEPFTFEWTLPR